MTTPYDPTENAIDAAIQRRIDAAERYTPTDHASPKDKAACAILNEAVRQVELNVLLYGNAVVTAPKQHSKSLYMKRLLDALNGRGKTTYVCSNKQDAAKLKRDIEAVDAQIRKDIGK